MNDPAEVFKQRVAGKNIVFDLGPMLVQTADGEPIGVEDGGIARFAFDEDGICIPTWPETDTADTTPERNP